MRPGRKPRPVALKIVDGTYRSRADTTREQVADGPLIKIGKPPALFSGREVEIWKELARRHPAWTEWQLALLPSFVKMKSESEINILPAATLAEFRKVSELLLAPRGIPSNGKTEKDNGSGFDWPQK
jgi:hypothetical protein